MEAGRGQTKTCLEASIGVLPSHSGGDGDCHKLLGFSIRYIRLPKAKLFAVPSISLLIRHEQKANIEPTPRGESVWIIENTASCTQQSASTGFAGAGCRGWLWLGTRRGCKSPQRRELAPKSPDQ